MAKSAKQETLQKFGENLRRIRENQDRSLRDVAQHCNVDYANIAKMEQGQINPTLTTVVDLAKGLGVQPDELLKF